MVAAARGTGELAPEVLSTPHPAGGSSAMPRVGVILAAGRSERLTTVTGGRSKAITVLGGTTLIERAVRTLEEAGVKEVVVVAGFEAEMVERAAGQLQSVTVIRADDWELGNGASLAAAETAVAGESLFAVLCADHVFAEGSLDPMLRAGVPAVLVDPAPSAETWAEGTRVRIEEGEARGFGKQLSEPAVDCGAFVLGPEVFDEYRAAAARGDHSLAAAVSGLSTSSPLRAIAIPSGGWWQDIDTPADLRNARSLIRRSLGKPTDGPVSRHLNRPISTRLTMALAPLRIHPNVLSLAFFAVGMVAAWSLSAERGLMGGLLVQVASVLDGVDGETARLLGMATPRGATLDAVLDRMVDAAIVAGLALWVWDAPSRPFRGGIIAASAITWALIAMTARSRWPAVAALQRSPATERRLGILLGGRDGRSLILAAGAMLGHSEISLWGAAFVWGATVAARTFLVLRRRSRDLERGAARTQAPAPHEVRGSSEGDLEEVG